MIYHWWTDVGTKQERIETIGIDGLLMQFDGCTIEVPTKALKKIENIKVELFQHLPPVILLCKVSSFFSVYLSRCNSIVVQTSAIYFYIMTLSMQIIFSKTLFINLMNRKCYHYFSSREKDISWCPGYWNVSQRSSSSIMTS